MTTTIPESILLHIFSFRPSFVFYRCCNVVLKYNLSITTGLVNKYYFNKDGSTLSLALLQKFLFLDYFLSYKHLLILDYNYDFECYLRDNYWVKDLCLKYQNNKIIHSSLRNIMRLSYFVNCLREIARYQREVTSDKIEQTSIGLSFQCLIENINKESETQTQMLKHYIWLNG